MSNREISDPEVIEVDAPEMHAVDETEVRDTDIQFDCPHCGKRLVIDYRGAGLRIACVQCGQDVLVPFPDGMQLADLDLDSGEILKQLFATRRNYQRAEEQIALMKERLRQLQETLGVMQEVVAEGLSES